MSKANVIKPLRNPPKDAEIVTKVYYPYTFFKFLLEVRKLLRQPVRVNAYVLVDMARNRAYSADSVPDIEEGEVDESLVVPSRIGIKEAERIARRFLAYYAMRVWKAFLPPKIEVKEVVQAYKIYLIIRLGDNTYLFDTLYGDVELLRRGGKD